MLMAVVVIGLAVFAWWLTRTKLWRSKSRSEAGGYRRISWGGTRARDDLTRSAHEHSSGLRKRRYD
jgi:hypothetical protein